MSDSHSPKAKIYKIDHKYQMSEDHEETTVDDRYNQKKRSDK